MTWFQSFNPFMIFAFTPFIIALWGRQAKKGTEPNTVIKMAIGCFGVALAYLVMVGALNAMPEGGGQVSWLWLFGFFVVITVAELYLSPVGLSLVNRLAPRQIASLLMGVWFLTSFFGNFLAGYLGTFWETMPKQDFFILMAEIAAGAGVVIMLLYPILKPMLKEAPVPNIAAAQGSAFKSKRV